MTLLHVFKSWRPSSLLGGSCFDALGMENGMIRDSQLSASSSVSSSYPASEARLNGPRAWIFNSRGFKVDCDSSVAEKNTWIQVTFGQPMNVAGIATQGGGRDLSKESWVTEYRVKYSTGASAWLMITDSDGNDVRMVRKELKLDRLHEYTGIIKNDKV